MVFGKFADKYFDLNINVIPIGKDKKPHKGFKDFGEFFHRRQTREELDLIIKNHFDAPGIAVCCGKGSKIAGFDYDYAWKLNAKGLPVISLSIEEYKKDRSNIEEKIKQKLPPWTLVKTGKVGWTQFFSIPDDWDENQSSIRVDRNNVRLFDFIINGYIVIPPSWHSDNIYYKWIEGDPYTEFQNLPKADLTLIQDLAFEFGNKKNERETFLSTRHGKIVDFISKKYFEVTDENVLLDMAIEYDKIANQENPYFADKKYFYPYNLREKGIQWIKRIGDYVKRNPPTFKENKEDNWYEKYVDLFTNKIPYGKPVKDILSKRIYYNDPVNKKEFVLGDAIRSTLECEAKTNGLAVAHVGRAYEKFELEFKEMGLLCHLEYDDSVDHVKACTDCLESKEFTKEDLYQIFMYWGVGIFRRILEPGYQNRCVVFTGAQGKGKDTWIKNLVRDFSPYYQSVDLSQRPEELTDSIQKCLIAHIEEYDQTKKYDVAFLKALITREEATYRNKYGRASTTKKMVSSWIATANVESILRDPTGNRRYILIPLKEISWTYPEIKSKGLAQFYEAFKRGEHRTLSQEIEIKIKEILDRLAPENNEELILEQVRDELKSMAINSSVLYPATGVFSYKDRTVVQASKMADAWKKIAVRQEVSVKSVQKIAKRFSGRDESIRFYYCDELESFNENA